jgi:uncharacterized protein YkwD
LIAKRKSRISWFRFMAGLAAVILLSACGLEYPSLHLSPPGQWPKTEDPEYPFSRSSPFSPGNPAADYSPVPSVSLSGAEASAGAWLMPPTPTLAAATLIDPTPTPLPTEKPSASPGPTAGGAKPAPTITATPTPKPTPRPTVKPTLTPVPTGSPDLVHLPGVPLNWPVSAAQQSRIDRFIALVNDERAANGLTALRTGSSLMREEAAIRAAEISVLFSHVRPETSDGQSLPWYSLLQAFDLSFRWAGENIAGINGPEAAMDAFRNSAPHLSNMLSPEAQYIAIGVYTDVTGKDWWSQTFIKSS